MELSRQDYLNGLPFPSAGDLRHPGIEPRSLTPPALAPYQLHDQHLLSRLIRTCQPVDQHLSAPYSAPVSSFISTYQLLD